MCPTNSAGIHPHCWKSNRKPRLAETHKCRHGGVASVFRSCRMELAVEISLSKKQSKATQSLDMRMLRNMAGEYRKESEIKTDKEVPEHVGASRRRISMVQERLVLLARLTKKKPWSAESTAAARRVGSFTLAQAVVKRRVEGTQRKRANCLSCHVPCFTFQPQPRVKPWRAHPTSRRQQVKRACPSKWPWMWAKKTTKRT